MSSAHNRNTSGSKRNEIAVLWGRSRTFASRRRGRGTEYTCVQSCRVRLVESTRKRDDTPVPSRIEAQCVDVHQPISLFIIAPIRFHLLLTRNSFGQGKRGKNCVSELFFCRSSRDVHCLQLKAGDENPSNESTDWRVVSAPSSSSTGHRCPSGALRDDHTRMFSGADLDRP